MRRFRRRPSVAMRRFRLLVAGLLVCIAAACNGSSEPVEHVARVGEAYLTQAEVDAALEALAAGPDTTTVRRQIIEQWTVNELLYQEAVRRGLREQPDVQRRLKENERSVLIDALISTVYADELGEVSPAEMRSYFEQYRERLRLREPFVRVRHLITASTDSAREAHRLLADAVRSGVADSVWSRMIERFAADPEDARALAANYYPESRLFAAQPALRDAVSRLEPGDLAPVLEVDEQAHVLQLVDRVAAGSLPEFSWVEDEIRRILALEARKQMYERLVQRLRTEAQARDALVIRE